MIHITSNPKINCKVYKNNTLKSISITGNISVLFPRLLADKHWTS